MKLVINDLKGQLAMKKIEEKSNASYPKIKE